MIPIISEGPGSAAGRQITMDLFTGGLEREEGRDEKHFISCR